VIAAYAAKLGLPDPLEGLVVGERPEPDPPPGWVVATVSCASVNPHDLWTLRGIIGYPFEPPVILGCDGAGLAPDGTDVVFHPVLPSENGIRMLTDGVDGTFAPRIALPAENLVPKPANLTLAEGAVLGTAWLTAWRMLFTRAGLRPGERVLVQGSSGGVATAAIMLARAAGAHVTATSRRQEARDLARELGAHEALPSGARLPERVDVVIETVGEATWAHTLRALAPGGRVVVAGATTGSGPPADLLRVAIREFTILGSMMGTLEEFRALCRFVELADLHPPVSQIFQGVEQVPEALRALDAGQQLGKIVVNIQPMEGAA
jgi:NADPH:quinone reductase-like Zn-dependent oxidoreductase